VPPLADVAMTLTEVAEAESPLALVDRPGTDTLYVAEREGRVRPLGPDGRLGEPVVDISDEVVTDSEQGLLDIEFSPDGATLYLHYSLAPNGDTRVVAYAVDGDAADTASRRQLLAVEQPYKNHNGGDIEFGPDGFLYVALGDGGSAGDPEGNGQDTRALLGKILRIDPSAGTGDGYAIPPDNPFADRRDGAPEVWLYGVRNPWRIAFDAESGDLWVADVGQNAYEEINVLPAASGAGRGANLGWNQMEATHPFDGGTNPEGAVLPVFEYSHADGRCSVTGGVVYRGTAIAGLDGAYLFTDYCDGKIRALRTSGGEVVDEATFEASAGSVVSFGTDAAGEVYVLSEDGGIHRLEPG
jgi:glucose/arabinose dehydrogenase